MDVVCEEREENEEWLKFKTNSSKEKFSQKIFLLTLVKIRGIYSAVVYADFPGGHKTTDKPALQCRVKTLRVL